MAPTTDYDIVLAPNADIMKIEVRERIKDGWQVYGGLAPMGGMLAQALVKTTNLLTTINSSLTSIKNSTASIDKKTPELD